jgi:hypothetical protein
MAKQTKTVSKVTKTQAQAAKKTVQERLGEADASVGLTKTEDGSYAVLVSFKKKPSKKLATSLSKGLDVTVTLEVVETAIALPAEVKPVQVLAKTARKA